MMTYEEIELVWNGTEWVEINLLEYYIHRPLITKEEAIDLLKLNLPPCVIGAHYNWSDRKRITVKNDKKKKTLGETRMKVNLDKVKEQVEKIQDLEMHIIAFKGVINYMFVDGMDAYLMFQGPLPSTTEKIPDELKVKIYKAIVEYLDELEEEYHKTLGGKLVE